jgi:hypothetical protein
MRSTAEQRFRSQAIERRASRVMQPTFSFPQMQERCNTESGYGKDENISKA